MIAYILLILGVACAAVGGEFFVRGTVGLAQWARVSPGVIGATVAAFATSAPELSVAVNSSIAGVPQLTLGDVLGSNVANVALVLAIALSISGMQVARDAVKRDFPVAVLVPIVTALLCLDGLISRFDGLVLLALFAAWIAATVAEARKQRSETAAVVGASGGWRAGLFGGAGLTLLILAGRLIVAGASEIAAAWGVSEFLIGATVVAIGTSTPELATAVISKLRGHDEVGLGTVLGSNIFNGLWVVSIAALITPIAVDLRAVATALTTGLVALLITYPLRGGYIGRRRGVLLLALYAVYLVAVTIR